MACQKFLFLLSFTKHVFLSFTKHVKKVTTISINPGFSLKQVSGPFLQTNEIK